MCDRLTTTVFLNLLIRDDMGLSIHHYVFVAE